MSEDDLEELRTRSDELQTRIAKECCVLYDGAEITGTVPIKIMAIPSSVSWVGHCSVL